MSELSAVWRSTTPPATARIADKDTPPMTS